MQNPELPESLNNFQSLEAMVAKDGSRRVYGVNEAGKKKQIAADTVLTAYGYGPDDLPKKFTESPQNNPIDTADKPKPLLFERQYNEAREQFEQKHREIIRDDLILGSGYPDNDETAATVENLLQIEMAYFDEEVVYDIEADAWLTPKESDMQVRDDLAKPELKLYDHKKQDPELQDQDDSSRGMTILQKRLAMLTQDSDESPDVPDFVRSQSTDSSPASTSNVSGMNYDWIPTAPGSLEGTWLDKQTDGKSIKRNPWYKRMWGQKYAYDDGYTAEDQARDEAADREILPFPNTAIDLRSGKREVYPVEDYEAYKTEDTEDDNEKVSALAAGAAGVVAGGLLANRANDTETDASSEETEDKSKSKKGKFVALGLLAASLVAAGVIIPQLDDDDSSEDKTEQTTESSVPGDSQEGNGGDEESETGDENPEDGAEDDEETQANGDDKDTDESKPDEDTEQDESQASEDEAEDREGEVEESAEDDAEANDETTQAPTAPASTAEELTLENAVGVENFDTEAGSGFVKEIRDFAKANNVEISNEQAFALYQAMLDTLGPNGMITGPTYEISPGNIGISNPGANTWTDEAAQFIIDRLPLSELPATE